MQMTKAIPAILAVWVWYLIWDNFLVGPLMGSTMAQIPGMSADFSKMWEFVGDLFAAGVLVWVYDKVKAVFGSGMKGGATYGFYAGVLINFPTWLWMTVYAGWPYRAAWTLVIVSVVVTTISGTLVGLVYEKVGAKAA